MIFWRVNVAIQAGFLIPLVAEFSILPKGIEKAQEILVGRRKRWNYTWNPVKFVSLI
jgi:hypothetical protein